MKTYESIQSGNVASVNLTDSIMLLNIIFIFCFDTMNGILGLLSTAFLGIFVLIILLQILKTSIKPLKFGVLVSIAFSIYSFTLEEHLLGPWSKLFHAEVQTAVSIVICTLEMICIFVYAKNQDKIEKVLNAVAVSGLCLSFLTLIIVRQNIFMGLHSNGMTAYLVSYGLNSNAMGVSWGMAFISALYLFYKYKNRKYLFYIIVNCTFLLLTGSRKAFMYLIIAFAVFFIFSGNHKISRIGIITVFLWVGYYVIVTVPFLYDVIGRRVISLVDVVLGGQGSDSTISRFNLIDYGIELFRERPIWGYGLNAFSIFHENRMGFQRYAHNNYIELLVSGGIVFTVLYYIRYVSIIPILIKKIRKNNTNNLIMILCVVYLLILLFSDFADVTYYKKTYYVILGIVFSCIYNELELFENEELI